MAPAKYSSASSPESAVEVRRAEPDRFECSRSAPRSHSSLPAAAVTTRRTQTLRPTRQETPSTEPLPTAPQVRLMMRQAMTRRAGAAEGSISVWAMGTEGENLDVLAQDFMAEFPDVSVEVTAVPWDAAHDKIVNSIAGGQVPDVSLIGSTWMGEFATLGGLEPTPSSIDPSQFFEGSWDTTVVDGVSYGVPWYVETRLIYYRTDLAEEGGFNQAPADWDEFTQLVQAQADAGAEFGISLQPGGIGSWQTYMPFFWQAGGDMLDESGSFTLGSEACVEALTFYDSFFEEGLTPPAVSDVPVEASFANGDVGSFISGPWMIGVVTDAGADPATWTVAHQPTEDAGTSFVGGGNLAVFEQSDNKAGRVGVRRVPLAAGGAGQVVRDGEGPAVGQVRVGRPGAGRRRVARGLRRAARGRQVAARGPDLGAGRGRHRRPGRAVTVGEHHTRGRMRGDAAGG